MMYAVGRADDGRSGGVLLGREVEREALDDVVAAVHGHESRVLLLRGEPGVGKTALLDYLVGRASGCLVIHTACVEAEMELGFSSLHRFSAPLLDRLDRLPDPQRAALRIVFGLEDGTAPDRFVVGLAVLGMLAEAARKRPVVCVIDDADWLDRASAQALGFVARRLVAESVALVFAVSDSAVVPGLAGLPELGVNGLGEVEARALLGSGLHGPVDERVLVRMLAEARGNPLALLELPKGLSAAELACGVDMPDARMLPSRIEESYCRQVAALPADTQRLLLVAAAEPLGDPVLVWRAAGRLCIDASAATPAVERGLLEIDLQVRFRHPLLRSAIYRTAPQALRQAAHQALAEATDCRADDDYRAWHSAQAATGPHDDVADELERSAERARARGGLASAAAFLRRSAQLTPQPARQAHRRLVAAQASHEAGMRATAQQLSCLAAAGPLDQLDRARAELLRGRIAFAAGRAAEATPFLQGAARLFERLDARLARETYFEAIRTAWLAGPLGCDHGPADVSMAARTAPPAPDPARPVDLLLDGLALQLADGYADGAPTLRRAILAFCDPYPPDERWLHWLQFAGLSAAHLYDDKVWDTLTTLLVQQARAAGALAVLPRALSTLITAQVYFGELPAAATLAGEQAAVAEATGYPAAPYGVLALAAWHGRADEATVLFDAIRQQVPARGEGSILTAIHWASAVLSNSLGRYSDAFDSARRASAPRGLPPSTWALSELIEAATRTGHSDHAAAALTQLDAMTAAAGTDWALGIHARCSALLTDGTAAEKRYREAIECLGRTRIQGELARAHLLYGEWLHRANRRRAAGEQLRCAHNMFTAMGAEAFAQRAARELGAAGATVRKQRAGTLSELTGQEQQIVRHVREGLSNPEIGARLFISPRTVEWHLTNIFSKLNIASRRELRSPSTTRREQSVA